MLMIKGFQKTLFAIVIALACVSTTFASAPVIRQLPDIQIGDLESYTTTDNNFFVFTNPFKFDEYVTDADSTVSQLLWSFDEGNDSETSTSASQWFTVNDKDPIHVGSIAQGTNDGPTGGAPHLNPGSSDLRAAGEYAAFRDIVFSPTSGSEPFPAPADPDKSAHEEGKVVTFYVSDQTNVTSNSIIVKSVDNTSDSISGASPFHVVQDDTFTSGNIQPSGALTGWSRFGLNSANTTPSNQNTDYDAANTAFRVRVSTVAAGSFGYASRFRITGWTCNATEWVPYSAVGTGNYVRAKFYLYASGQSGSATNQIPNIRLRAAARYALSSLVEIQHHMNDDPAIANYAAEIRPSTDVSNPSIYRVDFDPVDVPQMNYVSYGTDGTAYPEGIQRGFESFELYPQGNGYLSMTECSIGTIPWASTPLTGTPTKTYQPSASDAGDMKTVNSAAEVTFTNYNLATNTAEGAFADVTNPGTLCTYAEGTFGVTLDSRSVASNRCGTVTKEFYRGVTPAQRVRIDKDKQYAVRFHITSTNNANQQASLRLRAHTLKFAYTVKYELGDAFGAGSLNNAIAQQVQPGGGSQNTSGLYTLLMTSPMSADIQPTQTNIESLPGPGSATEGGTNGRDLVIGVDLVDTLGNGAAASVNAEKGNYTINKIDVFTFDQVED